MTNSSVQDTSAWVIKEWAERTHGPPMLAEIEAHMPVVRSCNAADARLRNSTDCGNIATIAASFVARLIPACSTSAYRSHNEAFSIENCSPPYPPVRGH
jgi:hypothetical protein